MNIKIKSTLLNASKATNLNFKVVGVNLSDEEITSINSINPKRNKVIERVKAIKNKGASLIFDKVDNSTFRNNLIMLDGDLPSIILALGGAIPDFTLSPDAQGVFQGVMGLALVQADLGPALHVGVE